jgi:multisubunit Na+/H+ antiporter MnhG subunit
MTRPRVSSSVLIVALIIFTISLAVDRLWWEALLFGIGFLLVATAVSSMLVKAAHIHYTETKMKVRATYVPGFIKSLNDAVASTKWNPKN